MNENYEFLQFNVEFNLLVVYSPVGDVFSNAFQLRHISPFALRSIGLARIITGNCRRLSIVMNTVVCVIRVVDEEEVAKFQGSKRNLFV